MNTYIESKPQTKKESDLFHLIRGCFVNYEVEQTKKWGMKINTWISNPNGNDDKKPANYVSWIFDDNELIAYKVENYMGTGEKVTFTNYMPSITTAGDIIRTMVG